MVATSARYALVLALALGAMHSDGASARAEKCSPAAANDRSGSFFIIYFLTKSNMLVRSICILLPVLVTASLFAPPLCAQSNSSSLEEKKKGKGREAGIAFHFYPYSFLVSALGQTLDKESDEIPFLIKVKGPRGYV